MPRKTAPELTFQWHVADYLVRDHKVVRLKVPEPLRHSVFDDFRGRLASLESLSMSGRRVAGMLVARFILEYPIK